MASGVVPGSQHIGRIGSVVLSRKQYPVPDDDYETHRTAPRILGANGAGSAGHVRWQPGRWRAARDTGPLHGRLSRRPRTLSLGPSVGRVPAASSPGGAPAAFAGGSDAQRPMRTQPRSVPGTRARRIPLGLLIMVGLLAGLRFAGQSTARTFFNVYLDDGLGASTALIGALAAVGQLLAVPAALATPLLLARWSKGRTIILGSLGQALSQCVLALVPHWSAAGFGLAGTTALFSMTTTTYRVFSQEMVPPRWRAAMSSALMMGGGLSFTLMSVVGGLAISALGYTTLFLIGAALTALGALLFWAYFRTPRGLAAEYDHDGAPIGGE